MAGQKHIGAHRAFPVGTTHKALWRYHLRPRWKFDCKLRSACQWLSDLP